MWYHRGMVYCISDIHGHYELFCRLLDRLKFGGGDRMYVLGDIVGKGRESIRLAKLLFSLPGVCCIAGNHEYDMLKRFRALTEQTGDFERALDGLRGDFEDGHLLDAETVEGFDSLPYYIETEAFRSRTDASCLCGRLRGSSWCMTVVSRTQTFCRGRGSVCCTVTLPRAILRAGMRYYSIRGRTACGGAGEPRTVARYTSTRECTLAAFWAVWRRRPAAAHTCVRFSLSFIAGEAITRIDTWGRA